MTRVFIFLYILSQELVAAFLSNGGSVSRFYEDSTKGLYKLTHSPALKIRGGAANEIVNRSTKLYISPSIASMASGSVAGAIGVAVGKCIDSHFHFPLIKQETISHNADQRSPSIL